MSSNTIGTIVQVIFIALSLILLWYVSLASIYFLVAVLLGLKFSFTISLAVFGLVMLLRMFYPKNVFV